MTEPEAVTVPAWNTNKIHLVQPYNSGRQPFFMSVQTSTVLAQI